MRGLDQASLNRLQVAIQFLETAKRNLNAPQPKSHQPYEGKRDKAATAAELAAIELRLGVLKNPKVDFKGLQEPLEWAEALYYEQIYSK